MSNVLVRFETYLARGPVDCAKLLGLPYSSYANLKWAENNGKKEVPPYLRAHVDTLMRMNPGTVLKLCRDRLAKNGSLKS